MLRFQHYNLLKRVECYSQGVESSAPRKHTGHFLLSDFNQISQLQRRDRSTGSGDYVAEKYMTMVNDNITRQGEIG
jgi:hypothetical protein